MFIERMLGIAYLNYDVTFRKWLISLIFPMVALMATIRGLDGASNSLHSNVSSIAPLFPSPTM